ncbi:MAG: histidine kinase [Flavobacteriales bacterium]
MRIFIALLFTTLTNMVQAQMPSFRNFSLNEGLPQSQVNAFATDKYGYVWIGTRGGGVARFDGKTFETFTKTNGLSSDFVLSLESFGNDVLIGTNKGLCYYDGSQLQKVPLLKGPVTAISPCGQGSSCILASGNKLVLFRKDHSVVNLPFEFLEDEIIADIECQNDTAFVCTDNGLFLFSLKQPFKKATLLRIGKNKMRNTFIRQLAPWHGGILLGTYGDGIYLYKRGKVERFVHVSKDEATIVTHLKVFSNGHLWVGTQDKGCLIYSTEGKRVFNKKNGLCSDHILSIHRDKWHNLWIGSSGQGFSLYREHPVMRIGNETDPGSVVYSVFPYSENYILVSSETKGFYYYEDKRLRRFECPKELAAAKVRCFVLDKYQNTWLGTDGDGIWINPYLSERWHRYTAKNGLNGNWVSCLTSDTLGNVWAGFSGGGIARMSFDNDHDLDVTKFKKRDGIIGDRITGICTDTNNAVWYACDKGGIGFILDGQLQAYPFEDLSIRHMIHVEDHFLAATPEGIIRFNNKGKIIREYTSARNEISSDNVYVLVQGGKDTLFAGQHNGVDMIVFDNQKVRTVKHIARESGFHGMEAVVRSGARDFDGSIWIGTVNGLYRIFPKQLNDPFRVAPEIHAKNISLLNVPIEKTVYANDFLNGIQLNTPLFTHTENQLSFEAVALFPQNPDALSYSWRLKGLEETWNKWQPTARSSYTNLPPGEYELQVKVLNHENLLTRQSTIFRFAIDAPYWKKAWFVLLVYGGGILVIISIFILITSGSRRKNRRKNERLTMEKNIVSLRQKALRLQMNPHFIFHSLNGIQNLVINKQEENARQYISRFSRLMRDMVELASAENITLYAEVESLKNYLELEKLSRDNSFQYSIEIGENVEDELVVIPPLILQPLAENALVHGFRNMKTGGFISIHITQQKEIITILIEDNGEGYEEGKKDPSSPGKTSTALKVTRERLELHYPGRYSFKIENVSNENRTGTRVSIQLHPVNP